MIRIFEVTYNFTERYDGEFMRSCEERKSVIAKNASEAIRKVEKILAKGSSWYDDEEKKRVVVTYTNIDPIRVTLEAQA